MVPRVNHVRRETNRETTSPAAMNAIAYSAIRPVEPAHRPMCHMLQRAQYGRQRFTNMSTSVHIRGDDGGSRRARAGREETHGTVQRRERRRERRRARRSHGFAPMRRRRGCSAACWFATGRTAPVARYASWKRKLTIRTTQRATRITAAVNAIERCSVRPAMRTCISPTACTIA